MLSINMRVFKSILLVSALFGSTLCRPSIRDDNEETSTSAASTTRAPGDFFDQRQNGTDNYRINLDGVVFVVAPVDSVVLSGPSHVGLAKPPKPTTEPEVMKPIAAPKSNHRPNYRLAQLLAPFLQRIRQD